MVEIKDKITELPCCVEYSKDVKELNLLFTNIDMIPRGLKGVNVVRMLRTPKYIAPDYKGEILINNNGVYEKLKSVQIQKAQFDYAKNLAFVESARYEGSLYSEIVALPINMCFYQQNDKVCLDLTKTNITEHPDICGVDEVFMPFVKLARHKGVQMVHSKPKIKE